QLEKLPKRAKSDLKVPDALLMFFDRVLAFDHVRKQIHIIATADVSRGKPAAEYARAIKDIAELERRLNSPSPRLKQKSLRGKPQIRPTAKPEKFLKAVDRTKEYIRAGDVFQCVLSQRLELKLATDPFSVYRAL